MDHLELTDVSRLARNILDEVEVAVVGKREPLTVVLAAILLKNVTEPGGFFRWFNKSLDAVNVAYTAGVRLTMKRVTIALLALGAMLFGTVRCSSSCTTPALASLRSWARWSRT